MSLQKAISPKSFKIDLSIERSPENGKGIEVNRDFSQLVFNRGTDKDVHVDVLTDDSSGNSPERYFNRDSMKAQIKDGNVVKIQGCKIYNEAQAGKELYYTVHVDTFHENGSLISDAEVEEILPQSGNDLNLAIAAGGTCQILMDADPTRRNLGILNNLTQPIWIKFLNNTNYIGKRIEVGAYWETKNAGLIYVLATTTEGKNDATGVGINLFPEY